uniref:Calponin-homology (CH) domain-containing protein n=1 Tax=Mesocestoides corti TaxID=53468 RepID=A0A5K3FIX6_MESCO
MSTGGKAVQRTTAPKVPAPQMSDAAVRRSPRIPKSTVSVGKCDNKFLRPLSRSVPRANPALFKSSSCHNIKSSRSTSQSSLDSRGSGKETKSRKVSDRKPASTVALPTAVLRESNSSVPGGSGTVNGDRIWVNSDLLSRVEKEKKQYESRISELTQLTEARKMEIERLSFEVRNLREAKDQAEANAQRYAPNFDDSLKQRIRDGDSNGESSQACPSCIRSPVGSSVGTTTRMTPSVTASDTTGYAFVDQQSLVSGVSSLGDRKAASCDGTAHSTLKTSLSLPMPPSVANLEIRIHEMEEANYTTTEELQATMEELCDLQRTLDEAQEDNRNLAFERAILLESLCTQTAKLEHCRLQIDQLKHLLLTSPTASLADSREAHYVELYSSVEEEKQILLTQNNDLAQRCETLDAECRQLTDRVEELTREVDQLRAEAAANSTMAASDPSAASAQMKENIPIELELEAQVDALMHQVMVWKDKFELERAEHEREATEWRLYERDLLKTVQVADGIKMESEAEVARITLETHELRDQVKRLSADLDTASHEVARLRDELSKGSPSDVSPSSIASFGPATPLCPSRPEMKSVATMTSSLDTSYAPSSAVAAAITSGSSPAPFQHLHRATYMQKLGLNPTTATASPGGPGGIRRSGPTVQSLIQTIENQVKAVQQQQKVSARKCSTSLTSTSSLPPNSSAASKGNSDSVPTRRLHSAGNSPGSTPVLSGPRHLLDEGPTSDSAPGGPPPLPQASLSSPRPQSPSVTSLRIKPIFNSALDDTPITTPQPVSCQPSKESFHVKFNPIPTPTSPLTSSTTARLKRHPTAPTTAAATVSTSASVIVPNGGGSSTTSAISEAVSSVLSAAAVDAVPSSGAAVASTDAPPSASDTVSTSGSIASAFTDPLHELAKRTNTGSKRNALLRWCQGRVAGYRVVEITNFSSSWNDGLALCALLHTYVPDKIPPWERVVNGMDKQRRFEVAFSAAERQGIPTTLRLHDMLTKDRPDWNSVMSYIAAIYKHFEAS